MQDVFVYLHVHFVAFFFRASLIFDIWAVEKKHVNTRTQKNRNKYK
jgi:hypothetical protein